MKHLIILLIFYIALSAGQVVRLQSSYKDGVKWEFGTNILRDDILARSNVGRVPVASAVYKKKPLMPMARKEPVITTVYKKVPTVVPDVYGNKFVVPVVHKREPVVQNVRKQQSIVPLVVFKAQSVASNIYKQQPAVSTVRKPHPIVSNIYKSQPIRPSAYHQEQSTSHHYVVPKVLPVDSQKKTEQHVWNPHQSFVRGTVHTASHN